MRIRFSTEILLDGKVTLFFECGHSILGHDNITVQDLEHNCKAKKSVPIADLTNDQK